jgi:hypothetical protein
MAASARGTVDAYHRPAGTHARSWAQMPQVVQPDRRQPSGLDQVLETLGEVVRMVRPPSAVTKT